jgi:hypothetical protein
MIEYITEMSASHTQEAIDNNVYFDIKNKQIIGMDVSALILTAAAAAAAAADDIDFCVGDSKMKLKDVTAKMWTRMRV